MEKPALHICKKCVDFLSDIDPVMSSHWIWLCIRTVKTDSIYLCCDDYEELRMLEQLAFVVTTEVAGGIFVYVCGLVILRENELAICAFHGSHDEEDYMILEELDDAVYDYYADRETTDHLFPPSTTAEDSTGEAEDSAAENS